MSGLHNLDQILNSLEPRLLHDLYVYCMVSNKYPIDWLGLNPLAIIREAEGITLVLTQQTAKAHNLDHMGSFRCISLTVHSSLEAVGLTAAISSALAEHDIPANMLAGYCHDHILVPADSASLAMDIIHGLGD